MQGMAYLLVWAPCRWVCGLIPDWRELRSRISKMPVTLNTHLLLYMAAVVVSSSEGGGDGLLCCSWCVWDHVSVISTLKKTVEICRKCNMVCIHLAKKDTDSTFESENTWLPNKNISQFRLKALQTKPIHLLWNQVRRCPVMTYAYPAVHGSCLITKNSRWCP